MPPPDEKPKPDSEEFFYLDEAGQKQDADLHGPILRAVDFPIIESIMGPIREKHRRKHQRSKAWSRARAEAERTLTRLERGEHAKETLAALGSREPEPEAPPERRPSYRSAQAKRTALNRLTPAQRAEVARADAEKTKK